MRFVCMASTGTNLRNLNRLLCQIGRIRSRIRFRKDIPDPTFAKKLQIPIRPDPDPQHWSLGYGNKNIFYSYSSRNDIKSHDMRTPFHLSEQFLLRLPEGLHTRSRCRRSRPLLGSFGTTLPTIIINWTNFRNVFINWRTNIYIWYRTRQIEPSE
jgi:hypothetical protein